MKLMKVIERVKKEMEENKMEGEKQGKIYRKENIKRK